jgi:HSP20 family molecular chaperone IbpA
MAENTMQRGGSEMQSATGGQAQRSPQQGQEAQKQEYVMRPPVDIFDTAEGLTLYADMPGVSKDRLNVHVDHNNLMIEGTAQIDLSEGMTPLYADVRSTRYLRSFTLSNELETERIDASLRDGVLTIRIPKRAELRPRKIEIKAS